MTPEEAQQAFAAAIDRPDEAIDLARAALYLAAAEYPALDVEAYVGRLDALAAEVAELALETPAPLGRLLNLSRYLFAEQGFGGNTRAYFDPRNSFLNEVLDRRTGIPITLSVVYLELGWRLGLPLAGVGMPGHFLVGYYPPYQVQYVDVFNQGRMIGREDCILMLRGMYGGGFVFQEEHLAPVDKRQILTRMLTNLKAIYTQQEDWDRALGVVERLLLLHPDHPPELRDRGLIQLRRGALRAAHTDLERYTQLAPRANDLPAIREQVALAWKLMSLRN
jgi:regulator of sirC expression with transglutaminase-like and TPR domain